jgi:hypothetical protein
MGQTFLPRRRFCLGTEASTKVSRCSGGEPFVALRRAAFLIAVQNWTTIVSLNTMSRRLSLEVPGIADSYAKTLLQEAFGFICDSQMWSFQLQVGGWLTPGLLFPGGPGTSVGTITATPYTNTLVGDATSSAAWLAYITASSQPFFPQLQIRSPYYSLYSILSVNATNPAALVLTLDRPWMEPGGSQLSYMIYQAYFPVPVPDFKRFLAARDTTNNAPMDFWTFSQKDLATIDPQRTIFDEPGYIVPYEQDQRPGSATFGNMLYELWPHPMTVLPYTFNFLRRGQVLTAPSSVLPYPMTEDVVLWQAKSEAYLWREAQKGEDIERGSGADYKFLSQAAQAKFVQKIKPIRARDSDLVELYFSRYAPDIWNAGQPFSNQSGSLNVGQMV